MVMDLDQCANPPDLSGPLTPDVILALAGSDPATLRERLAGIESASTAVATAAAEEHIAEHRADTETGRLFHRRLKLALWLRLGQLSSDETATRKALGAGR